MTVQAILDLFRSVDIFSQFVSFPIGDCLFTISVFVLSFIVAVIIVKILGTIVKSVASNIRKTFVAEIYHAVAFPIQTLLAVWLAIFLLSQVDFYPMVREMLGHVRTIVIIAVVFSLLWRLINLFTKFGQVALAERNNPGALSILLFASRVAKFLLIVIGLFITLDSLGVDVTSGLAALGIGGIALALGAQKTLENFVGSIMVVFDQPARVGDFCRVGNIYGTVEEIKMFSTRIRTVQRTLVAIPNVKFAGEMIENFAHRDRFLFNPTLGLRYETSTDLLRFLIVEIKSLLYAHPAVLNDDVRANFVEFDKSSVNIRIFCYIQAPDYKNFGSICDDLNFYIADLIHKSGASFAFPSQTLYLAKDGGLDKNLVKISEEEIKNLRSNNQLPIPFFDDNQITSLSGKIQYPGAGSSTASLKTGTISVDGE